MWALKRLRQLLNLSKKQQKKKLVVAASADEEVLKAVIAASENGIIQPILVGDIQKTLNISKKLNINIDKFRKIECNNLVNTAKKSVKLVSEGEADFIMKGIIDTSTLLKEVLNKDYGLRTNSLLSHVMVYEIPTYHKLILLTDGGMNINPSYEEKVKIIRNVVKVSKAIGNKVVKIAALAAKEKVSSKMPATIHADKLKSMCHEGKFGKDIIVEGPLALDLAISESAARVKGFKSKVAGDSDVLLVPNIEMGNGIGKSLTYFANSKSAGVVMGAKAPIVLVSRADTHESKLNSIALGSVIASK